VDVQKKLYWKRRGRQGYEKRALTERAFHQNVLTDRRRNDPKTKVSRAARASWRGLSIRLGDLGNVRAHSARCGAQRRAKSALNCNSQNGACCRRRTIAGKDLRQIYRENQSSGSLAPQSISTIVFRRKLLVGQQ
jgi:hypothetical protein